MARPLSSRFLNGLSWILILSGAGIAQGAEEIAEGTIRTMKVMSVALHVGSTDKDTKRVVYAPPPGWYIRSHRVEFQKRYGLASYTVSTVPAGWRWRSDEAFTDAGRVKATAGAGAYEARLGGDAGVELDNASAGRQSGSSSHHCLVLEVNTRGAGLWRGGSGIELTVIAEMVYVKEPAVELLAPVVIAK